jgi:hypothetical protein
MTLESPLIAILLHAADGSHLLIHVLELEASDDCDSWH